MKRLAAMFCALALTSLMAGADTVVKIPMKEFEKRGVYPRNFSVFHIAEDGRTILAADEPDFLKKKAGVYRRLWVFKLTPELKLDSARVYPLSIYTIEQANFTPDFKSVLISSKRGSDIHKLNLDDGTLTAVQTHTPGQAGFRIHSDIFSLYGSKVYTVGYFYDAEDVSGEEQMVEVDPSRTGKEAFNPVADMAPIQKQLKNLRIASMLHPQGMTSYCEESPGAWTVQRWNVQGGLQKIDEGEKIMGSWGEGPLALYSIRKATASDLVLCNAQTGETTLIQRGPEHLLNPCLAKDGNTLVVAQETAPDKVTYWVGQDADGFKLRKLTEGPRSTLRVSHNGQVVGLYLGIQGLTLIKLDPK